MTDRTAGGNLATRWAIRIARIGGLATLLICLVAFSGLRPPQTKQAFSLLAIPRLAAKPLPSDELEIAGTIRFLSERVRRDPEDSLAQNMLASCFLQRVRETNNADYLRLATNAARMSLASVPARRNPGGLSALAHAEFAAHEFIGARDHAILLTQLEPSQGSGWAQLGDALLELGDYEKAAAAYDRMQRLGFTAAGAQTRLARFALLRGEAGKAHKLLVRALALALDNPEPPRETVAWCYWQLGEVAFSVGEYGAAEEHYRSALTSFPGYVNALPSLGRVRAARGDLRGAVEHYEHAIRILPDPAFVAALGDVYKLMGRQIEAQSQYELVELIGRLAAANGVASNRQLVLFHADHELRVDATYRDAVQEFRVRRDIYGADAVAWSALKAGRLTEASQMIKLALRLGTKDAKLFYHAGMIAWAEGDKPSSRNYLERALALNPHFDSLQADILNRALAR